MRYNLQDIESALITLGFNHDIVLVPGHQDQITKNYRSLALKWHPDKCADKEAGERQFKLIGAAYETLFTYLTDLTPLLSAMPEHQATNVSSDQLQILNLCLIGYLQRIAMIKYIHYPGNINKVFLEEIFGSEHFNISVIEMLQDPEKMKALTQAQFESNLECLRRCGYYSLDNPPKNDVFTPLKDKAMEIYTQLKSTSTAAQDETTLAALMFLQNWIVVALRAVMSECQQQVSGDELIDRLQALMTDVYGASTREDIVERIERVRHSICSSTEDSHTVFNHALEVLANRVRDNQYIFSDEIRTLCQGNTQSLPRAGR